MANPEGEANQVSSEQLDEAQGNNALSILDNTAAIPNLSGEKQNELVQSIVSLLEADEPAIETEELGEDETPRIDLEDQSRWTVRLRAILPNLVQLWLSASEHFQYVTEKLADTSRNRELSYFFSQISPFQFKMHV